MDGDSIRVATAVGSLAVVAIAVVGYLSATPNPAPYVSGSSSKNLALRMPVAIGRKGLLLGGHSDRLAAAADAGGTEPPDAASAGQELVALLEQARAAVGSAASRTGPSAELRRDAGPKQATTAALADAAMAAPRDLPSPRPHQQLPQTSAPERGGSDAGPAPTTASEPLTAAEDGREPQAMPEQAAPQGAARSPNIVSVHSARTQVAVLPLGQGDPFAAVRRVPSYSPSRSARRSGAYALVGRSARPVDFARWTEGDRPPISILESRGKVLVLYAFQGWCPGCHRRGFPVTRALEQTYALRPDVEFIYVQSPFEGHFVNDFERAERERFNWNIRRPVAQDSVDKDGRPSLMRAYRSAGTPWHVIIDKGGVIRFNDFTRDTQGFKRLIDSLL